MKKEKDWSGIEIKDIEIDDIEFDLTLSAGDTAFFVFGVALLFTSLPFSHCAAVAFLPTLSRMVLHVSELITEKVKKTATKGD